MIVALRLLGVPFPRGPALWRTALYGVMVLGVGNACLTFSELLIPSSLAALFVSVSPLWMVGIEAAQPGGEKLTPGALAGIALGLGGAALLVAPDALRDGLSGSVVRGFLLLQLGAASWSFGSVLQRRIWPPTDAGASAAIQQLAAGLSFLPAALLESKPVIWDAKGVGAMLYLAVFGSIVGYTSYVFALHRLPVAVVSLHTYVNPVVAVILGRLFYGEPVGMREITAMAIIFAGVAVVQRYGRR